MKKHTYPRLGVILLCFIMVAGCSEEKSKSKLSFDNNSESIYWKRTETAVRFPQAHSGNYVSKIYRDNPFSIVLDLPVRDISDKPLRRAKIKAWFMLTSNAT